MLRTLLYERNNRFLVVEDPAAISDIVTDKGRYLWLDMEQPTPEEFQMVQEEFGLHPLAVEDAMKRHQRPKIEQYDSFYLVVFYSVIIEEAGQIGTTPGRRGLRGTRFLRPDEANGTMDAASAAEAPPPTEPEEATLEVGDSTSDERIVLRELTMFMGENYLITVHNHPIPELDEAGTRWRRNVEEMTTQGEEMERPPGTRPLAPEERASIGRAPHVVGNLARGAPGTPGSAGEGGRPALGAGDGANKVGILLYSLLDTIVDGYFPVMDGIVERIEDLEEQVFERFSRDAIEEIFRLKKDLLALRKVIAPERDVLNVLTRRDIAIFDSRTIIYFQDVYDHVVRITDSIDTYRDLLSSALDSYLSMQSNRLNETVQTLTSVSIILMSIAVFTGWYGMNFEMMPELGSRLGYPGIFLAVVAVVALEVLYFKRKGWL